MKKLPALTALTMCSYKMQEIRCKCKKYCFKSMVASKCRDCQNIAQEEDIQVLRDQRYDSDDAEEI